MVRAAHTPAVLRVDAVTSASSGAPVTRPTRPLSTTRSSLPLRTRCIRWRVLRPLRPRPLHSAAPTTDGRRTATAPLSPPSPPLSVVSLAPQTSSIMRCWVDCCCLGWTVVLHLV